MDSNILKNYYENGWDSRENLERYFSNKPNMVFRDDALIFPIENLVRTFTEGVLPCREEALRTGGEKSAAGKSSRGLEMGATPLQGTSQPVCGRITGDILIDLSAGPLIHHLYAASEIFKYIIALKVQDRCIMELKRWLGKYTGAFDWSHATKIHVEIEGNSDQVQDIEEKVRSGVQHVMKCDLKKENIMDPMVLPPADCIISAWLLDAISKDQDDYIRYLRKFSRLLKPGGHLMLIGSLDTTYYTVGKDKFHALTYDEDFVRKALVGEGFIIDYCKVKKRTSVSDLTDYKSIMFIAAHKEK